MDAFERALAGRFPENRILSHDLLEGCYARAGLLSDVQLYEENPSCYSVDVSRRHRWIRGDWQLAGWLLPRVPGPGAQRQNNPLSGLSRWKLFDNLRRSLVPSALTVLLLLGWTVLSPFWLWTLSVIGIILIPPCTVPRSWICFRSRRMCCRRQHFAAALRSASRHVVQAVLTIVCLPYEAFFSLDAIVRTIWRMLVTRTRLLEWSPSSDSDRNRRTDLRRLLPDDVDRARSCHCRGDLSDASLHPSALDVALPILGLWCRFPRYRVVDQPADSLGVHAKSDDQPDYLSPGSWPGRPGRSSSSSSVRTIIGCHRITIRSIPLPMVAHRTSPTNMGLALLANLSAYDFGYISAGQLIERTTNALHTMEALERHREPLLQLVRHAVAETAASRPTCRRWTAETSRAIC